MGTISGWVWVAAVLQRCAPALTAHGDPAAANRTGGGERLCRGVFCELLLQLRQQGLMLRRATTSLGEGRPRRLAGSISSTCHAFAERAAARAAKPPTHAAADSNCRLSTDLLNFHLPRNSKNACFTPAPAATSISLASLFAIASANELKSLTTIRKELAPPITFWR